MSSSSFARRGATTALTVLAAAVLFLVGFAPGSASAAKVKGSVAITIPSLKAGKLKAIAPAKAKRAGKRGAKVKAPVKNLSVAGPARVAVRGGLKLRHGKRQVKIRALKLTVRKRVTTVQGKLGKKKLVIFKARGKAKIDRSAKHIRLNRGKLSIPRGTAVKLKRRLKLRKAPTGKIGSLFVNAKKKTKPNVDPCVADPTGPGCVLIDQYNEECGVPVASKQDDSWPAASPLPTLASPQSIEATSIDWGFKSSFRGYVFGTTGADALQPLDGASRVNPPFDPTRGFSFPVSEGQFAANDPTDPADDQAVINGTGTGLFCNSKHFFWASISDPTVVIDGDDSRLVATVSQNINGNGMFGEDGPWQTPVRIDLADLDLSGATRSFNHDGSVLTWDDIPATLSSDAAPFATYPAGTALDPISVAVSTEATTPFPQEAYCSVTQTSTIADWPTSIPAPDFFDAGDSVATSVSSGGLDWGVRQGMRGTPPFNPMVIKASPDVTPSSGDLDDMAGAGKYFTWSAGSGAYYSEGGKLVLPLAGTVGLCSEDHGYGTVVSNPKVVIDGASSRIVADVFARVGVDWLGGTVDLVSFDASTITPTETPVSGGTEYEWTLPDGAVKLTEDGAAVIGPLGSSYAPGADFQGFTVRATVPTE